MLIALALAIVLTPVLVLAAIALVHGHQGAELEASMRWFASTEGDGRDRAPAPSTAPGTREPLAA